MTPNSWGPKGEDRKTKLFDLASDPTQETPVNDPASLAPLGTALAISLLVFGSSAYCLQQSQDRDRRLLSCYATIFIPALALAFGLGHLVEDMAGQHVHLGGCPLFFLLMVMVGLGVLAMLGFLGQQWRIEQHGKLLALPAPVAVEQTVHQLAQQLNLTPPIVHILPTQRAVAFVAGIQKPSIYLAQWFLDQLTPLELEQVLAHELAHIQRRDNLIALFHTLFFGATVFLPSSWWAFRHLLQERELAADELAVRLTGKPAALARALVKVVTPEYALTVVPGFLQLATIEQRVQNLVRLHQLPTTAIDAGFEKVWLVGLIVFGHLPLAWLVFDLPHLLHLP
jgi:Zn-dependent protease with chaperone function